MLLIFGEAILAAQAMACSGPGVEDLMRTQEEVSAMSARIHLAVVVVAAALLLLRKVSPWTAGFLAALLLVHPSWTMSSYKGDCGSAKGDMTTLFFGLMCLVVVWTVVSTFLGEKVRSKRDLV